MLRSAPAPAARRALAAVFLVALAGLFAPSCVDALGVDGYENGYTKLCDLVKRCYGDAFTGCDERVQDADLAAHDDWVEKLGASGCLDSCAQVFKCLDFQPVCRARTEQEPAVSCALNEDCCGYASGAVACEYGACCTPLGASCEADADCCPNTGFCKPIQKDSDAKTCGGVLCGSVGEACLNDFQCCSGRCSNGFCDEIPCPPEGFPCERDEDCCTLACVDQKCTNPTCAQSGEPCKSAADCCESAPVCNFGKPGADSGICSTAECIPNNADCAGDSECCSHYCHPTYHLCGECAALDDPCGSASPCCTGLACDAGHCASCASAGLPCGDSVACCAGLTCKADGFCSP